MVNSENQQKETKPRETEKPAQLQPEKTASEIRDERMSQINQELESLNHQTSTSENVQQNMGQREQEYQTKVAELEQGLDTQLGAESKNMIHQQMVDSAVEQTQKDKERHDNLQRLKKAAETLSPEDFLYFEKILGNQEGRVDQLYDLRGKVLHTTPDSAFKKILESGKILQNLYKDDSVEQGAYLTDADSEIGLTFHTLWDDVKSSAEDKKFSSAKYFDKVDELADFFWSTDEGQKRVADYFKKRNPDISIRSKDDLAALLRNMRSGMQTKGEDKATGVTLVFEKDELPELSKEGTNELNRYTEQRLYSKEGLDIAKVKTIFVPEAHMSDIRKTIQGTTLDGADIRPSEELEVIRMVKTLDSKKNLPE